VNFFVVVVFSWTLIWNRVWTLNTPGNMVNNVIWQIFDLDFVFSFLLLRLFGDLVFEYHLNLAGLDNIYISACVCSQMNSSFYGTAASISSHMYICNWGAMEVGNYHFYSVWFRQCHILFELIFENLQKHHVFKLFFTFYVNLSFSISLTCYALLRACECVELKNLVSLLAFTQHIVKITVTMGKQQ
jgi:hypothetical protein